jgi:hypothetical protein
MDQHPDDRLETPKQLAKRVGISRGRYAASFKPGS